MHSVMTDVTISKKKRLAIWLGTILGAALLVAAMLLWALYISHEQQAARVVARYVLCLELNEMKEAQRDELRASINESKSFIEQGGQIPGVSLELLQRGIERREVLYNKLAPYPGGCVKFARDPVNLNVTVPEE